MSLRSSRRETQLSSSQTLTRERVRHQRSLSSSRAQSSTHGSRGSNLDVSRVTGGGRGDDRITLNVGGLRYQTTKGTLLRVPNSVLTELAENALRTEEPGVNYEYFFDRSPALFPAILDYYRLRELHLDHAVCPRLLQQELEFWKIPESALADCCWARYAEFFEKQHTRKKLDQLLRPELLPPPTPTTETLRVGTHTAEVSEPHGDIKRMLKNGARTTFHKLRGARGDRIRLFMLSLRAASRELNLFLALLFIFTAAFAFIIRLVESSENIESTPQALWWALVTLTTIGFGGGGPQSILGYLAGVSAAVTGLIVAGILLPTLGARYLELSEHYEAIKRVRRREQQQQRASNDIAVNGKAK